MHLQRNPGTPLELEWVEDVRVNLSAVERRTATLTTRRSVKKDWQAAWLLRAISCMDLTTLSGDDTPGRVRRLCAKARNPVRTDLLEALGMADRGLTVGAVCVYHSYVETAVEALRGTDIPPRSPTVWPRSRPASPRSRPPCAQAPARSTSSSPGRTCYLATGQPSTTRCAPFEKPAVRRT